MTGRPARFLAKSTLFGNPAGRLAMDAFGSIPIYRAKESAGKDASRNEESFARCRAALAAARRWRCSRRASRTPTHRCGRSRPARRASRCRPGGARTAALRVVCPVGLFYERKVLFRSRVLLVVGEPLPVAPLLPATGSDERATVEALTDDIRARLDEVVLQAESRELLTGVARVAQLDAGRNGATRTTWPRGTGARASCWRPTAACTRAIRRASRRSRPRRAATRARCSTWA